VPGATGCPTTAVRPLILPSIAAGPRNGVEPDDPYVRTHWVGLIGPGAVADLLRLIAAARRERPIPVPLTLPTLLIEGLAKWTPDKLEVLSPVPRVSESKHRLRCRRSVGMMWTDHDASEGP
jgi:hypothetical protein